MRLLKVRLMKKAIRQAERQIVRYFAIPILMCMAMVASANSQINVAGNCNFIAVKADIVLSPDFRFPPACADPAWITEEYTRLFGAGGVPALMALQEVNGNYRQKDHIYWVRSYRFRDYFGDQGLPLNENTVRFWQTEWPHKDAKALTNLPLWESYSGNLLYSVVPDTFLHSHNAYELACYLASEPLMGLGLGFGSPVYETDFFQRNSQLLARLGEGSGCYSVDISRYEVGFTLLTLKNSSGRSINELEIHYKFLDQSNLADRLSVLFRSNDFDRLFELMESSPDYLQTILVGMGEEENNARFIRDQFEPSDYFEFEATRQPSSVMKLADLEPGEKVIALLNVYFTNRENDYLPIYYTDGIIVPDKIVYRSGSQTVSRKIRDPYRTQALRKGLSWGWASQ